VVVPVVPAVVVPVALPVDEPCRPVVVPVPEPLEEGVPPVPVLDE
jgi:hypothetical protein